MKIQLSFSDEKKKEEPEPPPKVVEYFYDTSAESLGKVTCATEIQILFEDKTKTRIFVTGGVENTFIAKFEV